MFLSDILNVPFVVDKDIENDPKAQEELKDKIHNPNREIMVKDPTKGLTKFFKLDFSSITNNSNDKGKVSLKPVLPGMGDISSMMAPKPKLQMPGMLNGEHNSNISNVSDLSVDENSSLVIPLSGGFDVKYECTVDKGSVKVVNGKIIYTAPSLNKVSNYSKYKDGDVLAQATITINSIKPGFLKNSDTITVSIKKLSFVADNSIVNDNLEQFMFDSKNLIGG